MQTHNVNPPINVTGRHQLQLTEALREYAIKKINGIHLDYPRIIEARVILDVQGRRQIAEILLFCANHIHIEAISEADDLYAAIDECVSKVSRRMRKFKTRLLRNYRPRKGKPKVLAEHVYTETSVAESETEDIEPLIVHPEQFNLRPLYTDEAIMDLEMSEKPFVVFENQKTHQINILYRRKDGDYGVVALDNVEKVAE